MPRRGRPPALTRDRVLVAAVDLVDREGVAALTMRALASDLGVEAMSLYHHLPGKQALLDGLVESVIGEVSSAVTDAMKDLDGAAWHSQVRTRCLVARQVMLRHPWAPALIGTRTSVPPGVYVHYEAVLAAMIEGGVSYALGHRAIHALGSMVLGFVQELFSPATGADDQSDDELEQLAEALPHITAMIGSEIHVNDGDVLGWCDSQAEFEFTLDLILDGLEARKTLNAPNAS